MELAEKFTLVFNVWSLLLWSQHYRKSNSGTFKDLQTQIWGLSRTDKSPTGM